MLNLREISTFCLGVTENNTQSNQSVEQSTQVDSLSNNYNK